MNVVLQHRRNYGAETIEHTVEIDTDALVPHLGTDFPKRLLHVIGRLRTIVASVVHKHTDGAELGGHFVQHGANLIEIADIGLNRQRRHP